MMRAAPECDFLCLFDVAACHGASNARLIHGLRDPRDGLRGGPLAAPACEAARRALSASVRYSNYPGSVTCAACRAHATDWTACPDEGPGDPAEEFGVEEYCAAPGEWRADFHGPDGPGTWAAACLVDPTDLEPIRRRRAIPRPVVARRAAGHGPAFLDRRRVLAGFRRGLETAARAALAGVDPPRPSSLFDRDPPAALGGALAYAVHRDPGTLRGVARIAAPRGVTLRMLVETMADVLGR